MAVKLVLLTNFVLLKQFLTFGTWMSTEIAVFGGKHNLGP